MCLHVDHVVRIRFGLYPTCQGLRCCYSGTDYRNSEFSSIWFSLFSKMALNAVFFLIKHAMLVTKQRLIQNKNTKNCLVLEFPKLGVKISINHVPHFQNSTPQSASRPWLHFPISNHSLEIKRRTNFMRQGTKSSLRLKKS